MVGEDTLLILQGYWKEIGFLSSFIYSQEYVRSFFADSGDSVRPLPASAMVLDAELRVTRHTHLVVSASIPIREEIVYLPNDRVFRYYYPKSLL